MFDAKSARLQRIGIWGHFHGANLGDDLVVGALVKELRARQHDAELVAYSLNPADTRNRHGIEALPVTRAAMHARVRTKSGGGNRRRRSYPQWLAPIVKHPRVRPHAQRYSKLWRRSRRMVRSWVGRLSEPRFAWQSYRSLLNVDLLIIAGSGPIYDGWNGPWVHPYNLFKWTLLARAAGTPVHMVSVGAGPIDSVLSRFFLSRALRAAQYVSFRDSSSLRLVQELGLLADAPIVPDQAFALELPRVKPQGSSRRVVGVNPMAHEDPRYLPRGQRVRYEGYLDTLSGFVSWLLDEDHEVRLFYSGRSDLRACNDLEGRLREKGALSGGEMLLRGEFHREEQLVEAIQGFDFVIGTRFHCILLAAAMGVPVVGLAYHPKTLDLLRHVGQGECALDIDSIVASDLVRAFRGVLLREAEIRASLEVEVRACQEQAREQYSQLYGKASERSASVENASQGAPSNSQKP